MDSWRYNVGAYRLAGLLGLADMMPVTIEYRYRSKPGSLAWWMDSLMDEGERLKKKVQPPDTDRLERGHAARCACSWSWCTTPTATWATSSSRRSGG